MREFLIIWVILLGLLVGCTEEAKQHSTPTPLSPLSTDTHGEFLRVVDRDFGIVCYGFRGTAQSLSCVRPPTDVFERGIQ